MGDVIPFKPCRREGRPFEIGDKIIDSPVGPGTFDEITDAGYPRVNGIAVTWMVREDGTKWSII